METNKPKLVAFVGLPASGKSTKAKELVEQGWVRTNKDTIRLEFTDYKQKRDEKKVVKERNRQIIEALQAGKNVVVDDTNLNPVHKKELSKIAKEYGAEFSVDDSFLQVPLWECIDRDRKREASVGASVIRSMFHQYIKKSATALQYDPSLPMVVICDIDGTLAHMTEKGRLRFGKQAPFMWSHVGEDDVDEGVAHLLDSISYMGYAKVFLFSGRNEVCRPETEAWLEKHDIDYDLLAMRPSSQNDLDDRIIKKDMLEKHVVGQFNVLFVVDDRPKVCRMWRDEFGLRVMNVGDPYYEF